MSTTEWAGQSRTITTTAGTTVQIITQSGHRAIICDHPDAPEEFRHQEVGRLIDGSFQSAPFAAFGLRPEVLRAVADLIEEQP